MAFAMAFTGKEEGVTMQSQPAIPLACTCLISQRAKLCVFSGVALFCLSYLVWWQDVIIYSTYPACETFLHPQDGGVGFFPCKAPEVLIFNGIN